MDKNHPHTTLVLVTDQFTCERIIKSARLVADLNGTALEVLSVVKTGMEVNPAALEHLFGIAKEYRARMAVTYSDNPHSAIVHFIKENHVVSAVTGLPQNRESLLVKLWKTQPNVKFFTVRESGELQEVLERGWEEPVAARFVLRDQKPAHSQTT